MLSLRLFHLMFLNLVFSIFVGLVLLEILWGKSSLLASNYILKDFKFYLLGYCCVFLDLYLLKCNIEKLKITNKYFLYKQIFTFFLIVVYFCFLKT